jgi:hypothetical protein
MYQSIARWPKPEQGGPSLGSPNNESVDTHGTMAEAAAVCHKLRTFGFGGDCKIYPLSTQVVQVIEEDPHFRIGQLEGAIKGVILHLQSWETSNISAWEERNAKIIAHLKELIGDSK